jgi:hypothetical protein
MFKSALKRDVISLIHFYTFPKIVNAPDAVMTDFFLFTVEFRSG